MSAKITNGATCTVQNHPPFHYKCQILINVIDYEFTLLKEFHTHARAQQWVNGARARPCTRAPFPRAAGSPLAARGESEPSKRWRGYRPTKGFQRKTSRKQKPVLTAPDNSAWRLGYIRRGLKHCTGSLRKGRRKGIQPRELEANALSLRRHHSCCFSGEFVTYRLRIHP